MSESVSKGTRGTSETRVFVGRVASSASTGHRAVGRARVDALVGAKYPQRYSFEPAPGETPEQVVARVRAIELGHAAKEAKVDELQSVVGNTITVGEVEFKVTDAIVRERGKNVELLVQYARLVGEKWVHAGRVVKVFKSLDRVIGNVEIEQLVAERVHSVLDAEAEHETFKAEVATLLGEGVGGERR